MTLFLVSLLVLTAGAFTGFIPGGRRRRWPGPASAVAGSALALAGGINILLTGSAVDFHVPWEVPLGGFHLGLDPLSAFFVVPIALIGGLAAVYGFGYLGEASGEKHLGAHWAGYNALLASMLLVVGARNGFLFLIAWELMSLSSFFLVVFDHEKAEVVGAGWTYLIASHFGTAFLLVMFLLLGGSGSLEFARFSGTGAPVAAIFVAAVIGFGAKAGFMPMHVWLPEAHPAAPSHVSAVMSGVMIKLGIYGLLRVMGFLGPPAAWWGGGLVAIGAVSGVGGVLYALAQHDIKRLLAYHSVENIGIIAIGLGIGILGRVTGNSVAAVLGFAGALLHVLNHAVFKSLLFFGAGSVVHATGTRHIDRLGGLIKRMPVTGATFLVGAAAISALPPLNGFVSEFLIYAASFTGVAGGSGLWAGVAAIGSLSLIGGLAAACFAKAFGIVFLGAARRPDANDAHESPATMTVPMGILAGLCIVIGAAGPWVIRLILPAVERLFPVTPGPEALAPAFGMLWPISLAALGAIGLGMLVFGLRRRLLDGRPVRTAPTWDCGYAAPTARMQYTAGSFALPIVTMFRLVLRPRTTLHSPEGLFPKAAALDSEIDDGILRWGYRPLFAAVCWFAAKFRRLQQGQTRHYILNIVLAVLLLLIWSLR